MISNGNQRDFIEWDGYEVYQNLEFSKISAKHSDKETRRIRDNLVCLTSRPLVGYSALELLYPKEKELEENIKECIEFCHRKKIPKMIIRTPYSSIVEKLGIVNITEEDGTIVLNLTKDLEELWNNLKKKTRQKIRQGEKKGCKCVIGDSNDFKKWWNLYTLTVKRKGFPSTKHDLAYEAFQNESISKFFICKIKSELACGILVLLSSRIVLSWLGASELKFLDYRPNFMLHWEMIKWGKKNGFQVFDLGGIKLDDPDHGHTFFKSGWGGDIKKYYVYELDIPSMKAKMIKIGKKIVPAKIKSAVKKKLK